MVGSHIRFTNKVIEASRVKRYNPFQELGAHKQVSRGQQYNKMATWMSALCLGPRAKKGSVTRVEVRRPGSGVRFVPHPTSPRVARPRGTTCLSQYVQQYGPFHHAKVGRMEEPQETGNRNKHKGDGNSSETLRAG